MSDAHDHSNHANTWKRQTTNGLSSEQWLELDRFLTFPLIIEVVALGPDTLLMAQNRVICCESCDPNAKSPFTSVLDEVTNRYDRVTDYLLFEPAKCRNCGAPIIKTTLVAFESKFNQNPAVLKYFGAPIEDADVVLVDEDMLSQAEKWITACERCSENAEHSFDQILDTLTGCDPTTTDYLMCRVAKCPCCHRAVTERTLVISS